MLTSLVSLQKGTVTKLEKSMTVVNIERENLSPKNIFLEKPQREEGGGGGVDTSIFGLNNLQLLASGQQALKG